MNIKKEKLHIYIAIAAGIVFFMLFFGRILFPIIAPATEVVNLKDKKILTEPSDANDTRSAQEGSQPFDTDTAQPVPAERADSAVPNPLNNADKQVVRKTTPRLGGLVQVLDLKEGDGIEAVEKSTVRVGYVGFYTDEETGENVKFDENTDPEQGFTFTIGAGQVIPGFDVGILSMRERGARHIIIDPKAGYGDRQAGRIPPNTTLQFIVELYEVQR